MDVISILEKKRLKPEEFTIEIEGVRKQTHPRVFTQIKILYRIKGNIPSKAVEQAIKLSMEKYCSVSAMLKSVVNIQWDYVIEN